MALKKLSLIKIFNVGQVLTVKKGEIKNISQHCHTMVLNCSYI